MCFISSNHCIFYLRNCDLPRPPIHSTLQSFVVFRFWVTVSLSITFSSFIQVVDFVRISFLLNAEQNFSMRFFFYILFVLSSRHPQFSLVLTSAHIAIARGHMLSPLNPQSKQVYLQPWTVSPYLWVRTCLCSPSPLPGLLPAPQMPFFLLTVHSLTWQFHSSFAAIY